MSNQNKDCRGTKRDCSGKFRSSNEEQIEQWLQELEEEKEFSDFDDSVEDPDFVLENSVREGSHDSENQTACEERINSNESNNEDSDEENIPLNLLATENRVQDASNYISKNGFVWSKIEVARTSRTPAHNIIPVAPHPTQVFSGFADLWSKIFDSEMLACIVLYTNEKLQMYREKFHNTNRQELRNTTETEIKSLIGLLYYSSVFKCNGADANYLFATDGTGHEIFRCVMSKFRFCTLLNCLRFDKAVDREERLATDPLAAVSWLFHKFVANSQKSYTLGPNTCIDEMLIPFRGRCRFIIYMPKKPAKYGLKLVILCDADTHYAYNAYIYSGKDSDGNGLSVEERKFSVPTQSVVRLCKPIENSNRNITADNWFSSIQLMEILKNKNLTYLGTLKKNKREIPPEFQPNKNREAGSSLYGFTKDYTLLSYVPKRNKAVILISSSHHAANIDVATQKPTMIVDYNHSKGGVDEIDKKCSIYSCTRKTRRWPMSIFYRIVDLSGVNTFAMYKHRLEGELRRGDFLLSLARDLVLSALQERVYNDRLPRELRLTIKRVLGNDLPPLQPHPGPAGPPARKTCSICPSKLKRQTRFVCCSCKKSICLQCASQLCEDCKF